MHKSSVQGQRGCVHRLRTLIRRVDNSRDARRHAASQSGQTVRKATIEATRHSCPAFEGAAARAAGREGVLQQPREGAGEAGD